MAALILLQATLPTASAGTSQDEMRMTTHSSTEPVLTKVNLDRVKRHIIQAGKRCIYANMYNNNPCFELADYRLYLNPDPGPDGHRQWNVNCDLARGDFNTLVVYEKSGASGYSTVDFRPEEELSISTHDNATVDEIRRTREVLEAAVREMFKVIDSGRNGTSESDE